MLELSGQKFGKLTVLRRAQGASWLCQCECGKLSYVTTSNLRGGNSKSCGCVREAKKTTHGMSGTPEHKVWRAMRSRCLVPSDSAYRNYGARGIGICEEWNDFTAFLRDMGPRPGPAFDLDRIDNSKGYSKENCRWTSRQRNSNNRRNNRIIEFNGRSQTIAEWARGLGIEYRTLNNRINRGWPISRALTEPPS